MKEYIERAAVLDRLSKVKMDGYGFSQGVQFGVDHAITCIKETPAADVVEFRHGRWEMVPYNGVYDMRCSVCGFCPGIRFYSSNYCPECGAKMGEE